MFRRKTQTTNEGERPQKIKRHFSIAFFLSIPGNFIIAGVFLLTILSLNQKFFFEKDIWVVFASGILGGFVIIGTTEMRKFRTFIHELKHALLVLLTGNRIKDFHFDTHTGHVQFQMASDKVHFAPIITLAPYFFPLFSIPALVACIVLQDYNKLILSLILGFTLAADTQTGFAEVHPHQTDLQKVSGGFFACALYLAGAHLAWLSACLLWVVGGRNGYVYSAYVLGELIQRFADRFAAYLSYT